jgi:hypothetical protein
MWVRTWVHDIGNYSYQDIDTKITDIYPFLASETAFENKSKLVNFASFVKNNFVTQSYDITDISITEEKNGYHIIKTTGILKRMVGKKEDSLSGLKYTYKLTCFARNGQIWIKNMETYVTEQEKDITIQKRLDKNDFVTFDTKTNEQSIQKQLDAKNQTSTEFNQKPEGQPSQPPALQAK